MIALATRAANVLFIAYGVLGLLAVIGFGWLTIAIACRKTMYPAWVAFANPIVCMIVAVFADRALPQPLARWLSGAGLSLGMLAFFTMSTIVLWRVSVPPVSSRA